MARLVILPAARADRIEIRRLHRAGRPEAGRVLRARDREEDARGAEPPMRFPARSQLHDGLWAAWHGRYLTFFVEQGNEVQVSATREPWRSPRFQVKGTPVG